MRHQSLPGVSHATLLLTGVGIVGGTRVRCLSAETQMRTHTGYALKESDMHDLRLLHDRFGIDYPDEIADLFSAR